MKKIIESLIESQRTVFSVGMLGYFWGEEDDVALRKKISYHAKVGFLEKITRGIYTVK
jgi:hypothetical protein